MTDRTVSMIVVSRNRPEALLRCLKAIEQLDYPVFEVIVVADPGGLSALRQAGVAPRIKTLEFDQPNVSAARNLGIRAAAGQVVAFIDDDSVPEPSWLHFLAAAFDNADVVAAGGYVRGRNGISYQSTAQSVDAFGHHTPLSMTGDNTAVFVGNPGSAIKTEGTNCAFRRETLLDLGGFDPAFHFFLDETDLNMRIARANLATAVVPMAQVHHGFATSAQRHASRLPRTLFDVGASWAVFLRKHAPTDTHETAIADIRADQRARLVRHMVAGTCEPGDVGRLMATLEDGLASGQKRPLLPHAVSGSGTMPFQRFIAPIAFTGSDVLAGRMWSAKRLRAEAIRRVDSGRRVSLFLFSPTALYHRVRFDRHGYWEQRGGLFGKSDRRDPLVCLNRFSVRLKREVARVRGCRLFTE